jgi:deoxyuridine 5'-triphosphate nucleotidohydrolase
MERKVELKVTGPGQIPNKAYGDDCGMDLFTFCEEPTDQESFAAIARNVWADIIFRNPDRHYHFDNYDRWRYAVPPNGFVDVDCGIEIQLPEGVWGLITGRSSAVRKKGLLIPNGIIDTGYRGRLFMPVQNLSGVTQLIEPGERIGQLVLMQNMSLGVEIVRVETLDPSERGDKGRGSTGK